MNNEKLRFIDLFAGIGGFRFGFEDAGCECVFSSEIDEHACEMYELNFGGLIPEILSFQMKNLTKI